MCLPSELPPATPAGEALDRLRRHAHKRNRAPHLGLEKHARAHAGALRLDDWLVPERMSLGYTTPFWAELREEERLALNHWIHAFMYTRIVEGEEYVIAANRVVAQTLRDREREPAISALLDREADEEVDHIAAFRAVRAALFERHGLSGMRLHRKPARALMLSPRTIRALIRLLGAEFVATYYTGRGIANHMGKAFEQPTARERTRNAALQQLTELHTIDESQHMAVSHLMSACAHEVLPTPGLGRIRRRFSRLVQWLTVAYTFSDRVSKGHERLLTLTAVERLRALRGRTPAFRRALVEAHFRAESGIEQARNAHMPGLNERLLARADLAPEDKALWRRTLRQNQGNLRFLPAEA